VIRSSMLSRFTPSLMAPETLEAILVRREKLAARLVDLVVESTLGAGKHHVLLVGPRGIGKTHLVSLVYHRVKKDARLDDRLSVAWLREEEWGIASFADLLLAVLRGLHEESRDAGLAERCEALHRLPAGHAEAEAERLLVECLGDRTLLLIAENLEELFRGLGDEGQRKLRALVQNRPAFTILATSPSLFPGVSLRTSPFYGFFEIQHLDELSFDDAVSLLVKIAEHEGDAELAAKLQTPTGRARIRAVHHLAGGNPRVYVIFSQFLTCESLDQLSDPLLQTLDDLTPYYQSRMGYLSPQQRKIVGFLCDRRCAVQVAEIAENNSLTHQTASGQLKKLREFGYVRAHQVGRESYYELQEPLMRLSLEVKKTRGRPLALLVDFLQLWYSREELEGLLDRLPTEAMEREYLLEAIRRSETDTEDPRAAACARDFRRFVEADELGKAMEAAEDAMVFDAPLACLLKAECLNRQRRHEEALLACNTALEMGPDGATAWILHMARTFTLTYLGRLQEAIPVLENAVESLSQRGAPGKLQSAMCALTRLARVWLNLFREMVIASVRKANSGSFEEDFRPYFQSKINTLRHVSGYGSILIQGIPGIFDEDLSLEMLRKWLDFLDRAAAGCDEFALPLRLLNAAVEYRESPDPRVLLRLPVEERAILEPLLPK
jgi:DNA-binding transcriptional ArsR family regulator